MKTDQSTSRPARAIATAGALLIAVAAAGPLPAAKEGHRPGEHPHHFVFKTHHGGSFLGVLLAELTPELRRHFGVGENEGVMISKVLDESPAARAGLRVGDIITAVDGKRVDSRWQLARSIRGKEDGAAVELAVWRDGVSLALTAAVEERAGEPHAMGHAFVLKCDDDEDDCSFTERRFRGGNWGAEFDCPGGDPCEVKVTCEDDDDCTCVVNGEETDCSSLPGFDG